MGIQLASYSFRIACAARALLNDPDVCRGLNRDHPVAALQMSADWLVSVVDRARGASYRYAIVTDRTVVGSCAILGIGRIDRTGWIGYWIGKDHWNRGYATEGVRQLTAVARTHLKLQLLFARCHADNAASAAVLIKCRYTRLGRQMFVEKATGRTVSTFLYGIDLQMC